MKYPRISARAGREVNIPQLSGGLNLRDSLTGIRDNQMTDCVNVWYKDGTLKTRPPFTATDKMINRYGKKEDEQKIGTRFLNEIKVFYKGCECLVAVNEIEKTDENSNKSYDFEFELQAVDTTFVMPKISGISGENITYFCAEMGGVLYCYISDYSIWKLEYAKAEAENSELEWVNVPQENRYTPTVYIHCMRSGWDDFEGTFFEGYNLISNRYKMIYSAYNEADSDESHPMRYALGNKLPESGEIIVEITSYDASAEEVITVEHKISYDKQQYDEFVEGNILIEKIDGDGTPKDGLYLFVKYNYIGFLLESEFTYEKGIACIDSEQLVNKYACSEDNVIITAPYDASENDLKKVFGMTRNTWFGGAANDIKGGSRLFLCGNTNDDEKSLVIWSGLNDPLYFGENCYAYIGGKSCAVTAFGKQGENLIVFKENKIYAARYVFNTDIDADDLINQNIVDYDANSAYFPFTLVNGFIGCDCPDTIQMCRNRLVWATSEGRIYTLCTVSQYNEHTVYELSDMVATKLKKYKKNLKRATSADFDGHYILFLDSCAFVMNYCCYGYQYVYSYSRSEDANVLIPWYFWSFDFLDSENKNYEYGFAGVNILDGTLLMRACVTDCGSKETAFVSFAMEETANGNCDCVFGECADGGFKAEDRVIKSRAVTKLFELGNGIYNVNIDNVSVKFGFSNPCDISVRIMTDQGEEAVVIQNVGSGNKDDVNFIRGKKIYPTIKAISKFGLRFECDGQLCIDGISMQYKILGGIK